MDATHGYKEGSMRTSGSSWPSSDLDSFIARRVAVSSRRVRVGVSVRIVEQALGPQTLYPTELIMTRHSDTNPIAHACPYL